MTPMMVLPLALSLSSTFTKVGALAAFVALVGIAVLALLVFTQARELKRLREWAGRAPERAAELEQRVSAEAAVRLQQAAPGAPPVRQVPRTTPLNARPENATGQPVGQPATQQTSGTPVPAAGTPAAGVVQPGTATPAIAVPQPAGAGQSPAGTQSTSVPVAAQAAPVAKAPAAAPTTTPAAPTDSAPSGATPLTAGAPGATASPPAPATVAGASAAPPRAPAPPAPRSPAPPSPPTQRPARTAAAAITGAAAAAATKTPSAASHAPSAPVPTRPRRANSPPPSARSPARATALILAAVVVGVVALVLVLSSLGGGSGKNTAKTSASTTSTVRARTHHSHPSTPVSSHPSESTVAASPAETHVVVLNGTTTEGLAHKLSASLQQSGYSQSTPLNGTPPGTHQTTVVEYAPGHRADAQGVANVLSVSEVQPLEAPVSALAAGATVVVVAGLDKAAAVEAEAGREP